MTNEEVEVIPNREELAGHGLDAARAAKYFFGKTLSEAEKLFAEGIPLSLTEALVWMNPIGFRFYIRAAIKYCLSNRAAGESDLINGLASTLTHWVNSKPRELEPCAGLLRHFCTEVVKNFHRYGADVDIYIGLVDRYKSLIKIFTKMQKAKA